MTVRNIKATKKRKLCQPQSKSSSVNLIISLFNRQREIRTPFRMGRLFPLLRWISGSLRSPLTGKRQFIEGSRLCSILGTGAEQQRFSAARLGIASHGCDLNPVMIIIARARLLSPSEADAIVPLAKDTIKGVRADPRALNPDDPLLWWFNRPTASAIRLWSVRIRHQLVGERTVQQLASS